MVNPYFDAYNDQADQRLYEDLVFESINFNGISAMYMPRSSQSKFDALFGDDPTKMFKQAYPVDVYVQTVDNFEGIGEIFTKFGVEVRKQAKFLVSKRAFTQAMPNGFGRPLEGDILWLSNFQAFLEIKYVEDESVFYIFGENQTNAGLYGFSLVCEKWIMAEEVVTTGQTDIDSTADKKVTTYNFIMSGGTANTYTAGEKVTSNANANVFATVLNWNKPTLILSLKHIHGIITANTLLVGQNSNARYNVASSVTRDNINDTLDNNQLISTQANTVENFDEANPFGMPVFP